MHGNSPALLPYALLEAIGRDEALLDPSELFTKSEAQGEIDSEDAAYWNIELTQPEGEPLMAEAVQTVLVDELQADPLIQEAIRLGGVVTEIEYQPLEANRVSGQISGDFVTEAIVRYLDGVHIITDEQQLFTLRVELLDRVQSDSARLVEWLRDNRVVFPGCESEVAAHILSLAQGTNSEPVNVIPLRSVAVSAKSRKPAASKTRRLDLLAVPDDASQPKRQQPERLDETAPLQLALF